MRGLLLVAAIIAGVALSMGDSSLPAPASSTSGCHPSYQGECLKQDAGDYDCEDGEGNGPNYTSYVEVTGYDEFDLDRDGDGDGCEGGF